LNIIKIVLFSKDMDKLFSEIKNIILAFTYLLLKLRILLSGFSNVMLY